MNFEVRGSAVIDGEMDYSVFGVINHVPSSTPNIIARVTHAMPRSHYRASNLSQWSE